MKSKEKMAANWLKNKPAQTPERALPIELIQDPQVYDKAKELNAYLAGFEAARELAAKYFKERTMHDSLYIPGFIPDEMRKLGEEEVE